MTTIVKVDAHDSIGAQVKPISIRDIIGMFDIEDAEGDFVPVWVYGTLRSNGWNNSVLGPKRLYVGNATLASDAWALTSQAPMVPFLVPADGVGKNVVGELWLIPFYQLIFVDQLEGCSNTNDGIYQRSIGGVRVLGDNQFGIRDGGLVDAIMYACPRYGQYRTAFATYYDWVEEDSELMQEYV